MHIACTTCAVGTDITHYKLLYKKSFNYKKLFYCTNLLTSSKFVYGTKVFSIQFVFKYYCALNIQHNV